MFRICSKGPPTATNLGSDEPAMHCAVKKLLTHPQRCTVPSPVLAVRAGLGTDCTGCPIYAIWRHRWAPCISEHAATRISYVSTSLDVLQQLCWRSAWVSLISSTSLWPETPSVVCGWLSSCASSLTSACPKCSRVDTTRSRVVERAVAPSIDRVWRRKTATPLQHWWGHRVLRVSASVAASGALWRTAATYCEIWTAYMFNRTEKFETRPNWSIQLLNWQCCIMNKTIDFWSLKATFWKDTLQLTYTRN